MIKMQDQLQVLNTLLAIKIKQDLGDGLAPDELLFVNKTIKQGVKSWDNATTPNSQQSVSRWSYSPF